MAARFELPKIEKINSKVNLTDDAVPTIKAMATNLRNNGYGNLVEDLLGDQIDLRSIESLEEKILEKIELYSKDLNDKVLAEIFHAIQLWGGKEGRYIYVRGEGFDDNFNLESYRKLVGDCMAGDVDQIIKSISEFDKEVKYLGISFITKHVRFWSSMNKKTKMLPIYDKIMAQGVMNVDTPKYKDLKVYWDSMRKAAADQSLDINDLERSLFNFYRGDNGGVT